VPLLDHRVVELAATMPANVKFHEGEMKHIFRTVARPHVPDVISERTDKMGFPVPLTQWLQGPAHDWLRDVFSSRAALDRELIDNSKVLASLDGENPFGRKTWGLMCLELWQRTFHDREHFFKGLLRERTTAA
jgi:asparagine synthase (glutamine-hydrolysing)